MWFSTTHQGGKSLYASLDAEMIEPLSDREKRILLLCGQGASNTYIAAVLHVEVRTVETYLHRAYGKLQATNRTNALFRAWYFGELRPYEMARCAEPLEPITGDIHEDDGT